MSHPGPDAPMSDTHHYTHSPGSAADEGFLDDLLDAGLAVAYQSEVTPVPGRLDTLPLTGPDAPAGTAAGRYLLDGVIGRGGMGSVLRGRDPELGRELAVKVLRPEHWNDPAVLRRFVEEAQIGGQLQHPGIVPVYDLGRFPDGRPYFTMKLVRGRTLATLLAGRTDPAAERPHFLKVFEQVCQTIAYAHAQGVIHRDLKPSNVMVGNFGEVQVMDWGLAKVLASGGAGPRRADEDGGDQPRRSPNETAVRTVRTEGNESESQAGAVFGTLAYMPPEQARGETAKVDERADVFGLGGILCTILTGDPPYRGKPGLQLRMQATFGDLSEAFARLDACGADAELIALAKRCLAPRPEGRPRDAGVVAAELAAYLEGVERRLRAAELAGAEARARAVGERKRRWLTVALAAWLLLTGAGVGVGLLVTEAARHRRRAEHTGRVHQALAEAAEWFGRAEQAAAGDLVAWERAAAAGERARGLLAAGEVEPEVADRAGRLIADLEAGKRAAETRAATRERDRRMLARLDDIRLIQDVSKEHFDYGRAVAEYDRAFRDYGIDPDRPLDSATRLRASPIRAALTAALDDWIERHPTAADRERLLALVRAAETEPDGWSAKLREARVRRDGAALTALAGPPLPDAPARTLAGWARALARAKEWAAAEAVLREAWRRHPGEFWVAYELAEFLRGGPKPDVTEAIRFYTAAVALNPNSPGLRNNFGVALDQANRPAEAEVEFRAAVRAKPDYARAHGNLGNALADQNRLAEAEASYRTALRLDPDLAVTHNNLGNLMQRLNRPADAEAAYRAAVRAKPTYAMAHSNLGNVLEKLGRREEAIAAYREAVRHDPNYAFGHNGLGIVLARERRFAEAEAAFREAVRSDPNLAAGHHGLGTALLSLGRPVEAEAALREAVRLDPDLHMARFKLGGALHRQKKWAEAEAVFREVLRRDSDYTDATLALATMVSEQGRQDEAEAVLRDLTRRRPDHAPVYTHLGEVLGKKGQLDASADAYREAIRLSPDLFVAHNNLGMMLRRQRKFAESLAALERAAGLAPEGFRRSVGRRVEEARRLADFDARLAAVLKGGPPPADGAARIELAEFALFHAGKPEAAARLFREGFAAAPELADDLAKQHRYNAACAAVRAAAAAAGDEAARWRRQALEWLRADLTRWADPKNHPAPPSRRTVAATLAHWQKDPDLAPVRDADARARLPEAERTDWRRLWADADALRRR